jgi:hypothetical protein
MNDLERMTGAELRDYKQKLFCRLERFEALKRAEVIGHFAQVYWLPESTEALEKLTDELLKLAMIDKKI